MGIYILKRLLMMIPVLLGITIISFAVMKMAPGDPTSLVTDLNPNMNEEAIKMALDVLSGNKADISSSSMNEYIQEIPANAFMAAMANDISSLAKGKSKVFIIKKTESAMFSLAEIKDNFNIRLNFTVKTLEDAKNMENVLRGLISLANMQLEEMKTGFKVPEDITIATKGKKVYMEMNYPSKALLDIAMGKTKFSAFHLIADFNLLP